MFTKAPFLAGVIFFFAPSFGIQNTYAAPNDTPSDIGVCDKILTAPLTQLHHFTEILLRGEAEVKAYFDKVEKLQFDQAEVSLAMGLFSKLYPNLAFDYLNRFPWTQENLVAFLEPIAKDNAARISEMMRTWNLSADTQSKIALMMSKQQDMGPFLQMFSIPNEADRIEIACRSVEHRISSYLNNSDVYKITSSDGVVKVLSAVIKTASSYQYFEPYFALIMKQPEAVREQFLLEAAENIQTLTVQATDNFQKFGVTSRRVKLAFLKKFLPKILNERYDGWNFITSTFLIDIGVGGSAIALTRPEAIDLVTAVIKGASKDRIKDTASRDKFFTTLLDTPLFNSKALIGALFERMPLEVITKFAMRKDLEGLHLIAEGEAEQGLVEILRAFSAEYPELLPVKFTESLWARVPNETVVYRMLREFFAQHGGRPEKFPEDSLETLCKLSGLSQCMISGSPLEKSAATFYELVLDIQKSVANPAFSDVTFKSDVFKDKTAFLRFLRALRDLHSQRGGKTDNWMYLLNEIALTKKPVEANDLAPLTKLAQDKLITEIKNKLAQERVSFTYEQFETLNTKWGDLEPVWTLLARFQANEAWKKEIPLLIEVFNASIGGKFKNTKFDVNNAAVGKQLSTLSAQEVVEWAQTRTRLTYSGPSAQRSQAASTQQLHAEGLTAAKNIIRDNLLPHIQEAKGQNWLTELALIMPSHKDWAERELQNILLDKAQRDNPHHLIDEMLEALPAEKLGNQPIEVLFKLTLAELVREDATPELVYGAARVLKSMSALRQNLEFNAQTRQITEDFRAIEKLFAPKKDTGQESGALIFSVVDSSPKLLLTVGDLVQTTSCQNYKTGSRIETLLGYVMDANVQVMASFVVTKKHFETFSDYNTVVNATTSGMPTAIEWNGNRRIVTFNITGANNLVTTITTRELGYAHLRQMIKLGAATITRENGKPLPGVRLEREYVQTHGDLDKMRAHHVELLNEIKAAINAHDSGPITVAPSRNPGGQYSDAAKGAQTGAYKIP